MKLKIDGEEVEVREVLEYGDLPGVIAENGRGYYLAESSGIAGEKAREYWKDMVENDQKEFICMVGEETLLSWALGNYGGPGASQVKSLEEWLDVYLDVPEEHFASYDGAECDVTDCSIELEEVLGFIPTVAYRCE